MLELFNLILVQPILNVLVLLYQGFTWLHLPYALGLAIIVLTIIIRLVLYPLTSSQLKASRKMQLVAPHISKLKAKHKNDAKTLQAETMKLYKEHGINPVAGCLPVIVQLPIIWALYGVLQQVVALKPQLIVQHMNQIIYFKALYLVKPWDQHFFGLPLGQSPSKLISSVGFLVLLFPLATAFFQFIQSKMMFAQAPQDSTKQLPVKKDAKPEDQEDFAKAFQTQSLYIFPLMIGFFAYNFPIGLSLYWNTFTIFGIIQQYRVQGITGLTELKAILLKK
jgi:YidC/Oxa1 family membrane protein insertase